MLGHSVGSHSATPGMQPLPGSSDRGTSQAGTLEWAAISYSGGSSRLRAVRLSTQLVTKHLFLSSCE